MGAAKFVAAAIAIALLAATSMFAENQPMGFFITSAGPGNGANLGGLAGADQHCQKLATAAGAGNRTWRAYLEHTRIRESARGQCPRPHRSGPVVQP